MDAGHEPVARTRPEVGGQVEPGSHADHEDAGEHHREAREERLRRRDEVVADVRRDADEDDVEERPDPRPLAERPPQGEDRDAEEDRDGAHRDPRPELDSLVERLPRPEACAGPDHEGDPEPEHDEAEEQARQPGQDGRGEESLAHRRMVRGRSAVLGRPLPRSRHRPVPVRDAAERRALAHSANGPPLPRRRDDRHRLALPALDGAGSRPHRLRDVPGQPQRVDPEPDPARLRSDDARRDHPDPRPPRPLRPPADRRARGLSRPDPDDRGDRRAGDARAARQRPAPRGVRQAGIALGGPEPGEGDRRGPRSWPPTTSRPSSRPGEPTRPCLPRRRATAGAATRRTVRSGRARSDELGELADAESLTFAVGLGLDRRARRDLDRAGGRLGPAPPGHGPGGRAAGPASGADHRSRRPALHREGGGRGAAALQGGPLRPRDRGGRGRPRHPPRRRPHPGLGDHPPPRPGQRGRPGARLRLLRRPRPARRADPARPDGPHRGRLRHRRVDLRRARARALRGGHPDARRGRPRGRPGGRRPPRPVVRHRPDPGARLRARSPHRGRRDPDAAALPRLPDGLEGVRHLPPPPGDVRRGDGEAPRLGRHARSTTPTSGSRTTSATRRRSPGHRVPT